MELAQNLAACQRHLQSMIRRSIQGAICVAGLAGLLLILRTASATDLDTITQRVTANCCRRCLPRPPSRVT